MKAALFSVVLLCLLDLHSHYNSNLLYFSLSSTTGGHVHHFDMKGIHLDVFSQTPDNKIKAFCYYHNCMRDMHLFFPFLNRVIILEALIYSAKTHNLVLFSVFGEHSNRWCVIFGFSMCYEMCSYCMRDLPQCLHLI